MFTFCLNEAVFDNVETFNKMRDLVKKKVLTVDEVQLYVESDIILFYNDLISYFNFNGRHMIGNGSIFPREMFFSYIEEHLQNRPKYHKFLQILKENMILGVSSMGYTIEKEPISLSKDQYDSLMIVLWDKISLCL